MKGKCVSKSGKPSADPDLYELLDVDDTAEFSDIKKSYRKLSIKYHPDKNTDHKGHFEAITAAYEILSAMDKRVLYDTGGMQAIKDYEKGNMEEGPDIDQEMHFTLADFYLGATRTLNVKRRVICRKCRATRDPVRCAKCRDCPAEEKMVQFIQHGMLFQRRENERSAEDCRDDRTEMEVVVDPGSQPGDRIMFKHMASQKPGQIPGHVSVTLRLDESAGKAKIAGEWTRTGNDLRLPLELTLRESLLGFERTIKHLDGHTVHISTSSVTRPGQVLSIEGEGMPLKDTPSSFGNLYLLASVIYPDSFSEAEQQELSAVKTLQRQRAPSSGSSSGVQPPSTQRGDEL